MVKYYRKTQWILFIVTLLMMSSNSINAQWGKALHYNWWERDRVLVPQAADYWPFVVNQGTIEMWFKPDSVLKADTHDPDYTYLLSKNLAGNNEGDMGLTWPRGVGELQCFIQDGSATTKVYSTTSIWEPKWYHLAYVWNVDDSLRVFIDGVQQDVVAPCPPVHGGIQAIVIGSGAVDLLDTRYETFRGTIDEVRISAIARHTTNFSPPSAPYQLDAYTLALWHFDDGAGLTATDATGNGFDAILGDTLVSGDHAPDWVDVERDMFLVVNEFLADPDVSVDNGDANGDGVRHAQHDEFVELLNVSGRDMDLTGWKIGDDERVDFQFPDGYILKPYEFLTIFGGGDVSSVPGYNSDPLQTRVFATGDSVGNGLSNSGDYIVVLSPDGSHDMYLAYGSKFGAGAPTASFLSGITWSFEVETSANSSNNNSLTLNPDGVVGETDYYSEMLTVSNNTFYHTANKTVTGSTDISFSLNVTVEGQGSTEQDTTMATYPLGTQVEITAIPADKWVFEGWYVDGEKSYGSTLTVLINNNTEVTAKFIQQFQVTPKLIFNEILADPASDPINGDANGDGIRESKQDEFVELVNISDQPFDLTGFQLGDDEGITFTFPDGYMVQPHNFVVVFGGGDVSNVPGYDADLLQTKVFIADSIGIGNGLANGGDFILLLSPDGAYDMYMGYSSKYNVAGPTSSVVEGIDFELRTETAQIGGNNNALVRSPDANIEIGDPFVEMLTIIDTVYWTPGTTIDGNDFIVVSVEDDEFAMPDNFKLFNNYPNPFNPSTVIKAAIPEAQHVSLKVYSINGELVKTLANETLNAGYHNFSWNGTNNEGQKVSSGIYFYQISAGELYQVKKMMLLK